MRSYDRWLRYLETLPITKSEVPEKRVLISEFLEELETKPSDEIIIAMAYLDNRTDMQIAKKLGITKKEANKRYQIALNNACTKIMMTMDFDDIKEQSDTVRSFIHHLFVK